VTGGGVEVRGWLWMCKGAGVGGIDGMGGGR